MNTNTNTVETTDLATAVGNYIRAEAKGFGDLVTACQVLATADAASELADGARAKLAAKVSVSAGTLAGHKVYRTVTASTYSKRVKVGRMAGLVADADTVRKLGDGWADANDSSAVKLTWREAFELACDTPSLDKFYEWLPKAAHLAKPKASRVATQPVSVPETDDVASEPVAAFRWDDAHIGTGAKALIASLRAQGADDVSIRLVLAEAARLVTPVRSVTNAA